MKQSQADTLPIRESSLRQAIRLSVYYALKVEGVLMADSQEALSWLHVQIGPTLATAIAATENARLQNLLPQLGELMRGWQWEEGRPPGGGYCRSIDLGALHSARRRLERLADDIDKGDRPSFDIFSTPAIVPVFREILTSLAEVVTSERVEVASASSTVAA